MGRARGPGEQGNPAPPGPLRGRPSWSPTLCACSQGLNLEEVQAVRSPCGAGTIRDRSRVEPRKSRPVTRRSTLGERNRGIPEATVARLPVYLRALHVLAERGVATVSSEELAAAAGVNSAKLRKDLSHLGSYGTSGVGYEVEYLVNQLSRELGLTQGWAVAIVGIGNLGRALSGYGGFASRGFRMAALLDAEPGIVGESVSGLTVEHIDGLETVIKDYGISF